MSIVLGSRIQYNEAKVIIFSKFMNKRVLVLVTFTLILSIVSIFQIRVNAQYNNTNSIRVIPIIAYELPDGGKSIKVDIIAENLDILDFKPNTAFTLGRCAPDNKWFTKENVCADMVFQQGITDNLEIATITLQTKHDLTGSIKIKLTYVVDDGSEKVYESTKQIGVSPANPTLIVGVGLLVFVLIAAVSWNKYGKKIGFKYKVSAVAFLGVSLAVVFFGSNSFNMLPETGTLVLNKQTVAKLISSEKGITGIDVEVSAQRGTVSNITTRTSLFSVSDQATFKTSTPDDIAIKTINDYKKYLASTSGYITFKKYDTRKDDQGTYVRFQQYVSDVPVYGGEVIVFVQNNEPKTITSTTSAIDYINPKAIITAAEAKELALSYFKKSYGRAPQNVIEPKLWVYDAGMVNTNSSQRALIYNVDMSDSVYPLNYFIDANTGAIIVSNSHVSKTTVTNATTPDISVAFGTPQCDVSGKLTVDVWFTAGTMLGNYETHLSEDINFGDSSTYHVSLLNVTYYTSLAPDDFHKISDGSPMGALRSQAVYHARVLQESTGLYSETVSVTMPICNTPTPTSTPTPTPTPPFVPPVLYFGTAYCTPEGKLRNLVTFSGNGALDNFYVDVSKDLSWNASLYYHKFFGIAVTEGRAIIPTDFVKAAGVGNMGDLSFNTVYYVRVLQVGTNLYSEVKSFTTPFVCALPVMDRAIYKRVYDGLGFSLKRQEGDPPTNITEVDNAYDEYKNYSDYLVSKFNWYGGNGTGGLDVNHFFPPGYAPISIDYIGNPDPVCDYSNGGGYVAYYNRVSIIFCYPDGVDAMTMAHEMTHAVTNTKIQNILNAEYNEGFSYTIPLYRAKSWNYLWWAPKTKYDENLKCDEPHSGGGLMAYMAQLFTSGGTQSGCTIQGIGWEKAEQISFKLYEYMTGATTLIDVYNNYINACMGLIGSYGITGSDCEQVKNAGLATMMDQPGKCVPGSVPTTPICSTPTPTPTSTPTPTIGPVGCNILKTTSQCNAAIASLKAKYPQIIRDKPNKKVSCIISGTGNACTVAGSVITCPRKNFVTTKLIFHEIMHQYRLSILTLLGGTSTATSELQASLLEDKLFANEPTCMGAQFKFKGLDKTWRDSNLLVKGLTSAGITTEKMWQFALGERDTLKPYVSKFIKNATKTADIYTGGICSKTSCPL